MKRILLKLSGEALAGAQKTGFDESVVEQVGKQVKTLIDQGNQVGVVIGGGNFWRGRSSESMNRSKADQIGMLATVMNCIYTGEVFRGLGLQTSIYTPFSCGGFSKLYELDQVEESLNNNQVVFFAKTVCRGNRFGFITRPVLSGSNQSAQKTGKKEERCT